MIAIVTDDQLKEGQRQLQRQRATTERSYQRHNLRNYIVNLAKAASGAETDTGETGGLLAFIIGKRSNNSAAQKNRDAANTGPILVEPKGLSGNIEKKGTSTFGVGGSWQEL